MQLGKGIASGFVAGLAVAGGAMFVMQSGDGAPRVQDDARIAVLDAQIQRLERVVSRLSKVEAGGNQVGSTRAEPTQERVVAPSRDSLRDDERAIAEANAMVDRALQSGQWSQEQATELSMAAANLSRDEHGRILARVSAAINAGRLQVELP